MEQKQEYEHSSYYHIVLIYAIMLLFGMSENVKAVVFPKIRESLGISNEILGSIIAVSGYGYTVTCCIAPLVFIPLIGIKRSLQLGIISSFVGFYGTILAKQYYYLYITLFCVWMAFGMFEVSTNSMAAAIFTKNSALKYSIMHFFYGLGSIISPYIATLMIMLMNESYRSAYYFLLFPALILFGLVSFSNFNIQEVQESESKMNVINALKDPLVWFIGLIVGMMEITELGTCDWAGLYFQDVYGMSVEVEGAKFASLFYLTFTISRLTMGYFVERIGYLNTLIINTILVIIIMISGFIAGRHGLYILMLSGAPIGLNWPVAMSVGVKVWGSEASIKTCIIIGLGSTLNAIFQYVTGMINDRIGNAWGYRSLVVYVIITLFLLLILYCWIGKQLKETKEQEDKERAEEKQKVIDEQNQSLIENETV